MEKAEKKYILKTDFTWNDRGDIPNRVYEFGNFFVIITKQNNEYFENGHRMHSYNMRSCFIDKKTNEIIATDSVEYGSEDIVKTNNKFVLTPNCAVTFDGKVICNQGLIHPKLFGKNLIKVEEWFFDYCGRSGDALMDEDGKLIFSVYDFGVEASDFCSLHIGDLVDGKAIITLTTKKDGKKAGLLNEDGKLINGLPYKEISIFKEGYFVEDENGMQSVLDKDLNVVDSFNFNDDYSVNPIANRLYEVCYKNGESSYYGFYNGKDWFNLEEKLTELFPWHTEVSPSWPSTFIYEYYAESGIIELHANLFTGVKDGLNQASDATVLLDKDFNVLLKSERDEKLSVEGDDKKYICVYSGLSEKYTLFKKEIVDGETFFEPLLTDKSIIHIEGTENWYGVMSEESDYLINVDTGETMFKDNDEYIFRFHDLCNNLGFDKEHDYLQIEAKTESKKPGNVWLISLEELRSRESYDENVDIEGLETPYIVPEENINEGESGQYVIPGFVANEKDSNQEVTAKVFKKTANN